MILDRKSANAQEVMSAVHEHGYVVVPDVKTLDEYVSFSSNLGSFVTQNDAEECNPYVLVSEGNRINRLGFSHGGLFPHTDRSIMKSPPDLVLLWCKKPADSGGESLITDMRGLIESLKLDNYSLYEDILNMSAVFSDENYSDFNLSKFFYNDGVGTYIRFRNDGYLFVPPKFHKSYKKLVGLILDTTIVHPTHKNEVIIFNNKRVLHGRRQFSGHRELYRLHVNTIDKMKGCIA